MTARWIGRTFTFAALVFPLAQASTLSASPLVLGWHHGADTDAYIRRTQAAAVDVVSPTWWHLREDGSVADGGDDRFAHWAREHRVRLWPLFGNGFDADRSRQVLTDPDRRRAVIDRIGELAARYEADGVNVDWENLHTEDADAFSTFMREAAVSWRARGLTVSVDITPRTDSWEQGNLTEAFDRHALGEAVDLVVLMTYDQHNRLRPDGPVAALPWVEESVRYLSRTVPAGKIVLGVPLYTYIWSDHASRRQQTLPMAEAPARLERHGATMQWDDELGLTEATYTDGGHTFRAWVEDERSLALKAALVPRYGLAGVAAWRLGFETPDAWTAIGEGLTQAQPPAPTPASAPAPSPSPPGPSPTPVQVDERPAEPGPSTAAAIAAGAIALMVVVGYLFLRRLR